MRPSGYVGSAGRREKELSASRARWQPLPVHTNGNGNGNDDLGHASRRTLSWSPKREALCASSGAAECCWKPWGPGEQSSELLSGASTHRRCYQDAVEGPILRTTSSPDDHQRARRASGVFRTSRPAASSRAGSVERGCDAAGGPLRQTRDKFHIVRTSSSPEQSRAERTRVASAIVRTSSSPEDRRGDLGNQNAANARSADGRSRGQASRDPTNMGTLPERRRRGWAVEPPDARSSPEARRAQEQTRSSPDRRAQGPARREHTSGIDNGSAPGGRRGGHAYAREEPNIRSSPDRRTRGMQASRQGALRSPDDARRRANRDYATPPRQDASGGTRRRSRARAAEDDQDVPDEFDAQNSKIRVVVLLLLSLMLGVGAYLFTWAPKSPFVIVTLLFAHQLFWHIFYTPRPRRIR